MLPALIHPFCNGASRTACTPPAKSEQLIYTAAAKEPLSPGINVCSKINWCSELKLGKTKGEVSLFQGNMGCTAEWSRSDGRTFGTLRREDEGVTLVLPDSSPSCSDLGICFCLGPVFFLQLSLLAVSPGSAKPNTALCCVRVGSLTAWPQPICTSPFFRHSLYWCCPPTLFFYLRLA